MFWLQRRIERRDKRDVLGDGEVLASEMVRARCPCRPSPKCKITEAALRLSSFCQTVSVV